MTRAHEVVVPVGERRMPASLALPEAGPGPGPAVVVLHELLGLNDDMRRIAGRFAQAGYAALAPDLFAGLGPQPICLVRAMAAYRRGGGPVLEAIEAARDWLGAREEVDAGRIGVAGFCMGGGFALLLGREPGVRAAAVLYGDVPRRAESLAGVCPVVAGYGERDRVFRSHGRRLEQHLRELGVPHDVAFYPDAGHSFMSEYRGLTALLAPLGPLRAGHHAPSAEDSWARILAFFGHHLA